VPRTGASRGLRPGRRWPISGPGSAAIDPPRALPSERTRSAAETEVDALLTALATPPPYSVPPLDDDGAIDELAFVLATEHLSMLEKISLLEQWRYDVLLRDVASSEGPGDGREPGASLQQIGKALLYLGDRRCRH
jgi:hypothetical protein